MRSSKFSRSGRVEKRGRCWRSNFSRRSGTRTGCPPFPRRRHGPLPWLRALPVLPGQMIASGAKPQAAIQHNRHHLEHQSVQRSPEFDAFPVGLESSQRRSDSGPPAVLPAATASAWPSGTARSTRRSNRRIPYGAALVSGTVRCACSGTEIDIRTWLPVWRVCFVIEPLQRANEICTTQVPWSFTFE